MGVIFRCVDKNMWRLWSILRGISIGLDFGGEHWVDITLADFLAKLFFDTVNAFGFHKFVPFYLGTRNKFVPSQRFGLLILLLEIEFLGET